MTRGLHRRETPLRTGQPGDAAPNGDPAPRARLGTVNPSPHGPPQSGADFVFRPRIGLAVCLLWGVLAVVWFGVESRVSVPHALGQLPEIVLVSTVVYLLFWRPRVVVGVDAVLLRNVLRDVHVPYGALSEVETQYALTLTTVDGRRHQAWAAPAGGRFGAARVTNEERKILSWSGPVDEIPASAGLRSDAGAVAAAIRRRWHGPDWDGSTGRGTPVIRWAWEPLIVLAAAALAVLVSALVG